MTLFVPALKKGRSSILLALGVCSAGVAWAQAPLPNNSPFLPGNGATATADSGESIELAGVSIVGARTDLIIYDKATKKSRWIKMGATTEGITALKYDPKLEQAVVRFRGVEKVLTLRKGTGPANAPMPPAPAVVATPLPAPPASAPTGALGAAAPAAPVADAAPTGAPAPTTPEAVAKQETEARMLVSDLLEIGMAQRKAYEEAQRKAAEQNGTNVNAPTTTPAPEPPAQPNAVPPAPPPGNPPPAPTPVQN